MITLYGLLFMLLSTSSFVEALHTRVCTRRFSAVAYGDIVTDTSEIPVPDYMSGRCVACGQKIEDVDALGPLLCDHGYIHRFGCSNRVTWVQLFSDMPSVPKLDILLPEHLGWVACPVCCKLHGPDAFEKADRKNRNFIRQKMRDCFKETASIARGIVFELELPFADLIECIWVCTYKVFLSQLCIEFEEPLSYALPLDALWSRVSKEFGEGISAFIRDMAYRCTKDFINEEAHSKELRRSCFDIVNGACE